MKTVAQYVAGLPSIRREAIERARGFINSKVPSGYDERLAFSMISWCAPGRPDAAALQVTARKIFLRITRVNGGKRAYRWFSARSLDELPLETIGDAIAALGGPAKKPAAKKPTAKKPAAKKPAATRATTRR